MAHAESPYKARENNQEEVYTGSGKSLDVVFKSFHTPTLCKEKIFSAINVLSRNMQTLSNTVRHTDHEIGEHGGPDLEPR